MNSTLKKRLDGLNKVSNKGKYKPKTMCKFFYNGVRLDDSVSGLDTSDVTDFTKAFNFSHQMVNVPSKLELDTSSGTNFTSMFSVCSQLQTIPYIDTSNGITFNSMFGGSTQITKIPPLNTSSGTDFNAMFSGCSSLTSIPSLDTSNGTKFNAMFSGCSSLTSIPSLDTSNGITFNNMFNGCSNLTTIEGIDLDKATETTDMFTGCTSLTSIRLYNIRTSISFTQKNGPACDLDVDSIVNICNELCVVANTQSVGFGSNAAKMNSLYCKIINDSTEKKPMVLCESTDEGAMIIYDYLTLKNWKLA